ncbi:MAG: beta-N-acetylhexosaminidase [Clostridiales bacterium]|jgi:hexosaminidase|nr:beta-N-acetylhexosaminidase [Clostridiales bacterium]
MNIIPKLKKIDKASGEKFDLRSLKSLFIGDAFKTIRQVIDGTFLDKLDINNLSLTEDASAPSLRIIYDEKIPTEGYDLKISKDGILIKASDTSGALYAVQTLRIAAKADTAAANKKYIIECADISDSPDRAWRGLLLDVARHFYTVGSVKKIIDLMLLHKLNVLHLHLTDDQGWRIEIKKYPLLTEIGSKREKTHIHGWKKNDDDGTPHSGYYTQDDIKDIVAYAALRGINIVPEIDMPAHFAAAFASYGHLACRDKKVEVSWFFGGYYPMTHGIKDWNRSACIGKKTTFDFVYGVIDEICELFPFGYFHIGGDEAPKAEWETCPDCQRLMQEQSLQNTKQLQGYFINKVNEYVKSKGKKLIAWNEVLQGHNLDNSVLIQYWTPRADPNVPEYLKNGGKVIMSKHRSFYFDMPYSQYPLKNTFAFTPFIEGITEAYAKNIVGVEGALWTEWIGNTDKLEFQLFPRMTAAAERAWSDDIGDYKEFLERLGDFYQIVDALDVNYAEAAVADPKNPVKRLFTTAEWYLKNQDREYLYNKELKSGKN